MMWRVDDGGWNGLVVGLHAHPVHRPGGSHHLGGVAVTRSLARQLQVALEHRVVIEQAKGALMARELVDAATAFERLRRVARSGQRTVAEVAREVLAGVPLPSGPAKGTRPTRELAVIAYQQAAGLHERIAALYEQLGHPDRARQEWQRAAAARAWAERAKSQQDSQNRPTADRRPALQGFGQELLDLHRRAGKEVGVLAGGEQQQAVGQAAQALQLVDHDPGVLGPLGRGWPARPTRRDRGRP